VAGGGGGDEFFDGDLLAGVGVEDLVDEAATTEVAGKPAVAVLTVEEGVAGLYGNGARPVCADAAQVASGLGTWVGVSWGKGVEGVPRAKNQASALAATLVPGLQR
jgi:hypothetical protein